MNAPRLAALPNAPSEPLSLIWLDPVGRVSLQIPIEVLHRWREFFLRPGSSGTAFLTGAKRGGGFVIDFEPLASMEPTGLLDAVRTRDSRHGVRLIGFAVSQSTQDFPINDRARFRQLMLEVNEPRLFLSAHSEGSLISATLFSWNAESNSSEPIGVAFPLELGRLEEQYYAPFTPVFFQNSSVADEQLSSRPALRIAEVPRPTPVALAADEHPVRPFPRRLSRWLIIPAILGAVVIGAYWVGTRDIAPTQPPSSSLRPVLGAQSKAAQLGMSVDLNGTVMEIRWNANSPEAKSAQAGRMQILDGDESVDVSLDRVQITAGRLAYAPRSTDTRIQLRLMTPEGIGEDSIRVIQVGSGHAATQTRSRPDTKPAATAVATTRATQSARKIFIPTVPKSSTAAEAVVLEPPPMTFASGVSALPPPVALSPLKLTAPTPARPPARVRSVTPPVAIGGLTVYVPPGMRTAATAGKTVSVKVHVSSEGRVIGVEGANLTGLIAEIINDNAKRWRFKPATAGGKPIRSEMTLHLKFPSR